MEARLTDDIADDVPITLAEACTVVFRGKITPATLRAEACRGNLVIERIGRRDFVTLRGIREMREKCRVEQRGHTSGTTTSLGSGMSETDRSNAALAAVAMNVRRLKKPSVNTSAKNIHRLRPAAPAR